MLKPIQVTRPVFIVSLLLLFLMIVGFVSINKTARIEAGAAAFRPRTVTICSSFGDPLYTVFKTSVPIGILPGGTAFHTEISSKSDSAKIYFDQGLLMYYSYHTQEAAASFDKAISFDSTCAMIYWGKAISYYKYTGIYDGFQDSAAAVSSMQKAMSLQKGASPFEADVIAATSDFISGEAYLNEEKSLEQFETAMRRVYKKYPLNPEAATFYAFARTWNLPSEPGEEKDLKDKNLELLYDSLLRKFPLHPGINHQFIHFIESKNQLEKGRHSAEILLKHYGQISHLVHMASHIYIRNGNYKGGIQVNEEAINLFDNYMKLYPPLQSGYGKYLYVFHARSMGFANSMMLSNDARTQTIASTEANGVDAAFVKRNRKIPPGIQFDYMHPYLALVRYGKWKEVLSMPELPDSMTCAKPIQHFSRGISLARLRDLENARQELTSLKAKFKEGDLDVGHGFNKLSDYMRIMAPFLSAVISEEAGEFEIAKKHYEEAIILEDSLIDDDPVQWYLPVRQYYGNMYLKVNDPKSAEVQFRNDLQRHPANYWSLRGLLLVLRSQKNLKESKIVESQIKNIDTTTGPEPRGAVF